MSSRDMTLTEFKHTSKAFDDTHTVKVSGFKDRGGRRVTAIEVQKELRESVSIILKEMRTANRELLAAINNINNRLDKLEEFEQYVMDVFKRNNLK